MLLSRQFTVFHVIDFNRGSNSFDLVHIPGDLRRYPTLAMLTSEDLDRVPFDKLVLKSVPESVARIHMVLPLSHSTGHVHLVVPDDDAARIDELITTLRFILDRDITFDSADRTLLEKAVDRHYSKYGSTVANCHRTFFQSLFNMKRCLPSIVSFGLLVAFATANCYQYRMQAHRPWLHSVESAAANGFWGSNSIRGWPIELGVSFHHPRQTLATPERPVRVSLYSWNAGTWVVKGQLITLFHGVIAGTNLLIGGLTITGTFFVMRTLVDYAQWSLRSMLIAATVLAGSFALLNANTVNPLNVGRLYGGTADILSIRYCTLMTLNLACLVAIVWWASFFAAKLRIRPSLPSSP